MIAVIILRTQPETCNGPIIPRLRTVIVPDQIADGELVAFDPEFARSFNAGIYHHSTVGYDDGFGGVARLV